MTDIKDRLHQMMLRSGFQSRIDQDTLLAGVQEIARLRAERDVWETRAMEYGARLARVMSDKIDDKEPG